MNLFFRGNMSEEEAQFLNSAGGKRRSLILDDEYDSCDVSSHSHSSIDNEIKLVDDNEDNEIKPELETKVQPDTILVKQAKEVTENSVYQKMVSPPRHRYKTDGSLRSNFEDRNMQPRSSIFDTEIQFGSNFYGFFVAVWFIVFFFSLNVVVNYWNTKGSILTSDIALIMWKDIWKIGLTDTLFYLSLYIPVLNQLLIKANVYKWRPIGRWIQILFELAFFVAPTVTAFKMDYPWIGQIFLMLHGIVLLMKTHSFAFFNGYLWDISNELAHSREYKKKHLKTMNDDLKAAVDKSIEFCEFELEQQKFPQKLTLWNFFEFSMFPTLVYETTYPRTSRIRWDYLLKKVAGIFGVIFVLLSIAQQNLYPIVLECLQLQKSAPLFYRVKIYPLILIRTIPSFLSIYLLVFYLIWELILNAIAELSMFGDRWFYSYWWNSVDWSEYARDWNVPVHKFLLRHVYHSSISALHVKKGTATLMTFLISSVIHELAMYVIFKKARGYLLLLQMSQIVLVKISRSKWLRDKTVLGNCVFWFGIIFGPSLMCTMYLVF